MFWLDTTILSLLGLAALVGACTGFVYQIARVVSISLSVYASVALNGPVKKLFEDSVLQEADPRLTQAAAYVAVFLAVYLTIYYGVRLVRQGIKAADLVAFDRFLGAFAGAGKMALVLAGIFLGLLNYNHPLTQPWFERSTLAPVLASGMEHVLILVPEECTKAMQENLASLASFGKDNLP